MKTVFFVGVFLIIFSTVCYSQTWREREVSGYEREYTVITRDQYDRLLRQYTEDYSVLDLSYYDVLDLSGIRAISGTKPTLNGYYYLLIKRFTLVGVLPALAYGNSDTGRMEICFSGWGAGINSNEYVRRYNQYIKRINGE